MSTAYSVIVGNDALRDYRTVARGMTRDAADERARAFLPVPAATRRYAFVAIVPDGGTLSDAVMTLRGTA